MKPKNREQGFTLAEVIVAVAVTTVLATGIVGALLVITGSARRYNDDTQLTLLSRALANDIAIRGLPKNKEGSFDTHQDYHWRIELGTAEELRDLTTTDTAPFKEVLLAVTGPRKRSMVMRMIVR